MRPTALLALEDGSLFRGVAIGATGATVGEVVFNTSMTGYQEILTDPSYRQQMVTLTYPHIGNTGTNAEDVESGQVQAAGLIMREIPRKPSNWRNQQGLSEYLDANGIVAIADIDTRRLTRLLRDKGAQNGCIMAGDVDAAAALEKAKAFPGLVGADLAAAASTETIHEWIEPVWRGPNGLGEDAEPRFHVAVYDYGVKRNILRLLVSAGARVTVVPARTPLDEVVALGIDGIVLSNGPGDPASSSYGIETCREILERDIPMLGICLGHQFLGLAVGGKSMKMKYGHHGANHPVMDLDSGAVMISSQNHGFAIDESTLPDNARPIYRSLFDDTLQGIEIVGKPAFSFQGHPEASPGPRDVAPLFARFIRILEERSQKMMGDVGEQTTRRQEVRK